MDINDVRQKCRKRAKELNRRVSFSNVEMKIKYEYIVENAKNSIIHSKAVLNTDSIDLLPTSITGSSGPYTSMFMDILDYWVGIADVLGLNRLTLINISNWQQDSFYSFMKVAETVGFTIMEEQDTAILDLSEYDPCFDILDFVVSYFESEDVRKKQSTFEYYPVYAKYKTNQFFAAVCYINGIRAEFEFYKESNHYYFKQSDTGEKVEFTKEDFDNKFKIHINSLLEEQKLQVLINPPTRNLTSFLNVLPGHNKIDKETIDDIMDALINLGYSYLQIEEASEKLYNRRKQEVKTRDGSFYLNGYSKIIKVEHEPLSFGWMNILPIDNVINYFNHYVLLWKDYNSEDIHYTIFRSMDELKTFIQNKVINHLNSCLVEA